MAMQTVTGSPRDQPVAVGLLVVGLAFATYLGYRYDRDRAADLTAQLQIRSDAVLHSLSELTTVARAEADSLALRDALRRRLRSTVPPGLAVGSSLLELSADGRSMTVQYVVNLVAAPLANNVGETHPVPPGFNLDDPAPRFFPQEGPTHIVYCARSRELRVACSWVGLEEVMRRATRTAAGMLALQLRMADGTPLATSNDWLNGPQDYNSVISTAPAVPFTLAVKPTAALVENYRVGLGLWGTVIAYVIITLGFVLYVLRVRHARQHDRLSSELKRQQSLQATLLLKAIATVAAAAGIRFFLARPDGSVELFGPWEDESGLSEGSLQLDQAFRYVVKGDEAARMLSESVTRRESWSAVLQQDIDGESSYQQARAAPVYTAEGEFIGLLGVTTNVTKAIEAETAHLEAQRARDAQANYLRFMAHEVRAPIIRSKSAMTLLIRSIEAGDRENALRWMDVMDKALTGLSDVVKASLELMRLRQIEPAERPMPVELADIMARVSNTLAPLAVGRAQTITMTSDDGCCPAMSRAAELAKLLELLITNALQYSPEGSEVHVGLAMREQHCLLTIEDEGPGVSSEELRNLGKPFMRGSQATAFQVKGQGLGIPMALEYARIAGATVDFECSTRPGRGLLVTVRLGAAPQSSAVRNSSRA